MDNNIINETAHQLRQYKRAQQELKEKIEQAEQLLKEELCSRGTDFLETDEFKISWKTITSTRLDHQALKRERPEIYARYTREVETRRFTIT